MSIEVLDRTPNAEVIVVYEGQGTDQMRAYSFNGTTFTALGTALSFGASPSTYEQKLAAFGTDSFCMTYYTLSPNTQRMTQFDFNGTNITAGDTLDLAPLGLTGVTGDVNAFGAGEVVFCTRTNNIAVLSHS
tara:strand:- start:219 stop:614 length:396 start_codon:yes stop_codon:yes gene_type:complete